MFKVLRRWWRYLAARLGVTLDEVADPKVQLEQAIADAREQHRLLSEQAANVLANRSQIQHRLDRAIADYEKANASARQALVLADQAERAGETERAATLTRAAEGFGARIVGLEGELAELERSLLAATETAERAREAVGQNAVALRRRLGEREKLLSQLDQARLQEQMNAAMAQLERTVGDEVPSLEEVRAKIERRLAVANATGSLTAGRVETAEFEVERALAESSTRARLGELRQELGLAPAGEGVRVQPAPKPAIEAGGAGGS